MLRARVLLCLIILLGAGSALGDKVYLKDGRKLSGTANRHSDGVDLTTDDGQQLSFTKDEVKRIVFESTSPPGGVLDMLDEFEDLIAPAFGLGEPSQENPRPRSVTVTGTSPQGPGVVYRTYFGYFREAVGSDRFVDEWVRFSAHFQAVAKTHTYKHHTRPKLKKKSLAEFAMYPPEELKEAGEALQDAIGAVKETFKLAERADKLLGAVRYQEIRCDREIAAALNRSRRTSAREGATSQDKGMARAYVAKLEDDKKVKIKAKTLLADTGVNQVAVSRIIAICLLAEARGMLEKKRREEKGTSEKKRGHH